MIQTLLTTIIVFSAIAYLIHHYLGIKRKSTNKKNCGGCDTNCPLPSQNQPPKTIRWHTPKSPPCRHLER